VRIIGVVATAGVVALAGCGGSESASESSTPTAEATPVVALDITNPGSDSATVRQASSVIQGTSETGAHVTIAGAKVRMRGDGAWAAQIKLHVGENRIDVAASKSGSEPSSDSVVLTRQRSAAEIAELRRRREEARRRREAAAAAARAQREADFRASAQTIAYSQLEKNADAYHGTKAKFYGQIFQIQEDSAGGGIMLLSVTDEGYGIWDDNIWVDYDGHVQGAEGDTLTVYGTITGSKSYETQIGGETYVPRMRAKYIDE
jgi:hypothetical protein